MRPIEAAYDLYGGRLQVFRLILLPLALPGIIAGCLLVFIPIPRAFNAPVILGGGPTLLLATSITFVSMSFLIGRRRR